MAVAVLGSILFYALPAHFRDFFAQENYSAAYNMKALCLPANETPFSLLSLIIAALVVTGSLKAQTSTATQYGNTTYYSDGGTATHCGNTTYFSDATTATQYRNTTYFNAY
jgi:hypothetical protein